MTERKQKEAEEQFIQSADEAKKTLLTIEKDIQKKSDFHTRTLDKIKNKCHS